jgi:hypothetical protein
MENANTSTALEVTTDANGKRVAKKITLTGVVAKPRPKLATGVTASTAPNSAKAVADAAAKAKPGKPAKPGKAQPAKPAPNADRTYKPLVTFEQTKVRPGTWTTYMVEQILRHTSTAKATEATRAERERSYKFPNGNPKPLDFNWAAKKGFIQFLD